jgi:hypothetical protein
MKAALDRTFYTFVRPTEFLRRLLESDPYAAFELPPNAKRVITFLRKPHTSSLALPLEVNGAQILTANDREIFTAYVATP